MMLCGVSVVFNSLGDVLGLMSCKRSSENGQLLVGFQSTEAFGLPPSCRRRSSATPSRRFATASHCDRRGARSPSCSQLSWCRRAIYRQAEAVDGQHLVESFEDAGSDTGRLLIKAA